MVSGNDQGSAWEGIYLEGARDPGRYLGGRPAGCKSQREVLDLAFFTCTKGKRYAHAQSLRIGESIQH